MDKNVKETVIYPFTYRLRSKNCKDGNSCSQIPDGCRICLKRSSGGTHLTNAVHYHFPAEKAKWVFQSERTVQRPHNRPAAVTARYSVVELITQREKVRSEIKELLKLRLMGYSINADDFSIVNLKFSQQLTQTIKAKQTAELYALKAQRDLERIKIEDGQKVTQAQAEALRLQKANITSELEQLRQIEASLKAIQKWDGHLPRVTSDAIPFIGARSYDNDVRRSSTRRR